MTSIQRDFTGRVHIVERLKNTRNGNSRFLAVCIEGSEAVPFQTRADTSAVICLQNLNNKRATVTLRQNLHNGRWMLQDINAAE